MWSGAFGEKYTDRNNYTNQLLDEFYLNTWGVTRKVLDADFLLPIKNNLKTILEVGCNRGCQLFKLKEMGFSGLHGVEIQSYAIEKLKEVDGSINVKQGSILDIPFPDNSFDLVYTSGVLIHISPKDIELALKEIIRVSRRYI